VCGGIVWQLQKLRPVAGWGVIDALGAPKSAWNGLAQVLRPTPASITNEDLGGLNAHSINETVAPNDARPELACLGDSATKVASASKDVTLAARSTARIQAFDLRCQVFDFTYAYGISWRARDASVITLPDKISEGQRRRVERSIPRRRACLHAAPRSRTRVSRGANQQREPGADSGRSQRAPNVWHAEFLLSIRTLARRPKGSISPGRERRIPLVGRQRNTCHPPDGEVRAQNATFSIHCQRD
jgi:beta-mannosidase